MNADKLRLFIENGCKPIADGDTLLRFYLSKNGVIYYYRSGRQSHYIQTVLENMGTTETNKYMIEKMGMKFDYPKPVDLVKYLLSIFVRPGDIVLDSFAGSGTTAHAVLAGPRAADTSFILIEMEDYAETTTAERVKKVISGYSDVPGTGGNFSFYDLGEPLLIGNCLNKAVDPGKIREYVWFMETKTPFAPPDGDNPYYLGRHNDTGYYFCYEPQSVTVLDYAFLATVKEKASGMVIYADRCSIGEDKLAQMGITFKKIPRDISRL